VPQVVGAASDKRYGLRFGESRSESRVSQQQQRSYARNAAKLRMEAEAMRFNMMRDLIDRLPAEQQSVAAAQLLQLLMGATEEIANDTRIDGANMLQLAGGDTQPDDLAVPAAYDYTEPQGTEI
jgi:hypothetical protein